MSPDTGGPMNVISQRSISIVARPAIIEQHDTLHGGRVRDAWPAELPHHSLQIHLYISELVDDWKIHPFRQIAASRFDINQEQESSGRTIVDAANENDLRAFVQHFGLGGFVIRAGSFPIDDAPNYFVELHNAFSASDAHQFIDTYKACINRIAIIQEERNRALDVDGGFVGQRCVDHFHAREQIQLDHIHAARQILGKSLTL